MIRHIVQRVYGWWDRMGWRPDEQEAEAKDQAAEAARRRAIAARVSHERARAHVEFTVGRTERLADAYARAASRAAE